EIYGWLIGYWAIRVLIFQTATSAEVAPLRLSFTGTLRVIRRAVPRFQFLQPQDIPFFLLG
ncbi:MAG: IS4 family transposase, partial [Nostoc sp.]